MKGFTGPIEDRLAIRELIDGYNDAVFRRSEQEWGDCWVEDAVWTVGGATIHGRDAMKAHWSKVMEGYPAVGMYVNHGALAVDGDRAEGRCYMIEMLKTGDGGELLVSGHYDDAFRRDTDGRWRFVTRSYTVLQLRQ